MCSITAERYQVPQRAKWWFLSHQLLLFSTIMLQNQGQLMKQQNTPFCPLWCFVPFCSGTTQIRFQEGLATDRYTAADNETDPQPASCTSHSSTAEFLGGHEQLTWVLGACPLNYLAQHHHDYLSWGKVNTSKHCLVTIKTKVEVLVSDVRWMPVTMLHLSNVLFFSQLTRQIITKMLSGVSYKFIPIKRKKIVSFWQTGNVNITIHFEQKETITLMWLYKHHSPLKSNFHVQYSQFVGNLCLLNTMLLGQCTTADTKTHSPVHLTK